MTRIAAIIPAHRENAGRFEAGFDGTCDVVGDEVDVAEIVAPSGRSARLGRRGTRSTGPARDQRHAP